MVPLDPSRRSTPSADVGELEIRASGIDRFTVCPPPGQLGQPWYSAPGPWSPPAGTDAGAPEPIDQDYITRTNDRTLTEIAVEATRKEFRSCYRRGLVHDAAQDGRVAVVLRIGSDGRVARVEEQAACELGVDTIACIQNVAGRLRFPPPAAGSETVVIPAVFTSRDGVRRTRGSDNEAFTAAAYLVVEAARPLLHACEDFARREHLPVEASGTFTMSLGADGAVTHVHVDPLGGDATILGCAASALGKLRFASLPAGSGTVVVRLNFNPRQGTR